MTIGFGASSHSPDAAHRRCWVSGHLCHGLIDAPTHLAAASSAARAGPSWPASPACSPPIAWSVGSAGAGPVVSGVEGDHHSAAVVERAHVALAAHDTFSTTGTPGDFVAYLAARDADRRHRRLGDAPRPRRRCAARGPRPISSTRRPCSPRSSQIGKPYRSATSDPEVGFDCSGLTAYAWGRAGFDIPNQSGSQISVAADRDQSSAVAGDLTQYPGHVSMWLGVGEAIVHASNPENDVELNFNRR